MQQITQFSEIPEIGSVLLFLYTTEIKSWATVSLAKLVRKHPTIQFVKTDVSVPSEIDDVYSVSSVPAFMFLKDRVLMGSYSGTDLKYVELLVLG